MVIKTFVKIIPSSGVFTNRTLVVAIDCMVVASLAIVALLVHDLAVEATCGWLVNISCGLCLLVSWQHFVKTVDEMNPYAKNVLIF